ncbi:MAG: moderate conductance mechanosensitive channel, partial [Aliidongia sp.]|nr:moderate conductance mechanosensitive channel [Aliidongia sp.]
LIKELQALIAAERHEPAAASAASGDLIDAATARLQQIGDDLVDTATVLIQLPDVAAWSRAELEDEHARNRWLAIGRHVLSILGAAILADLLVTLVARRLRRPLARQAGPGWGARAIRLLSLLAVDALPIAAFALAGYVVTSIVQPKIVTAHVSSVAITAIFTVRVLQVLARTLLLSPRETGWTLLPLGAETSNYLYIWVRRFVFWAIYGFAFCTALWWLGVPGSAYAVMLKAVALVLTVLGIVFTLQNRQAVANWLRPIPRPEEADATLADPTVSEPPPRRRQAFDLLRHRLADFWHVLVIVYITGIFAVYVLRIENGFSYVFRATVLSIVILVTAKLLNRLVARLTERGFALHRELKNQFPTLEARANRYLPILNIIVSSLIWAVALLAVLESWGVSSFSWVATETGRRVAGSLVTVVIILALAFLVWEVFNTGIDRYLAGVTGNGNRISRSARMHTLLPLLRNVLFVVLLLVVGLVVLSEVGVNIAPLLGVSAVAGVAIGFGSQALVKDIITGLFILVEDTMAVGDVVDFGGGFAGAVEGMSIRTIKLRDGQGTLQVIPFGEVTKIKNLSRDFAYHVIDLLLPFTTDTDAVSRILTEIGAEMSADPTIGPMMAAPIEIIGLVAAGLEGVKLEARIKTRPLKQWAVQRDFNRRLKRAFDAAGITPPGAGQTISFDPKVIELIERFGPGRRETVEEGA